MKFSSVIYSLRQGFKNIWRNKMFSLASIATMAACIFLLGIFYSLGINFSKMVESAEESIAVTVFFDEGLPEDKMKEIGDKIDARKEVSSYKFVSAEEAWNTAKKEFFKGNEEVAASFADDNPMANSANYQVYMKDVSKQDALVKYLKKLPGVRQVNQSKMAAGTLTDFSRLMSVIFAAVILILVAVAIFLISNTITVGISVRKDEIAIMKLIGAKDSFVRAPFVVEGLVIGLVGSGIPVIVLWFMYQNIVRYITSKFEFLSNIISFVPEGTVFKVLVPLSLALGVGIGYLGSRVTLHRHLNV